MPVKPDYFYLILSFFLLPVNAAAQFTDSIHYSVNYATAGSINKTNDGQTYLLNNAAKFGIKKKAFSLNFSNSWVYGKQDRQLTNNDFSSSLDFNLYSSVPHFFYWGLANYNTSKSLQINNQLLTGAGVAYSIYDRKDAYLNISDGFLFDSSDLLLKGDFRDVYQTYRNSLRVVFKFVIREYIVLDNSTFFQPSLKRADDYNFRSNSALSFKVSKWLSLTTALNYNRVSRTDRENLLFTYGLSFEKFF
ncbi:DUF481 domain-containing protein [Pedobacter hartonius]|uniref:DUF481 domain-containing protein n=1 Tax=Pedobacter hartonius TaxID=425514 RepID=A0A1H3X6C6_9SPHI|nr:DUF481 domain-containing protein [Pedobacter hartonius]SDZ94194.1 Protein of unknown function, DUF481 [Pedobacter hartonius]